MCCTDGEAFKRRVAYSVALVDWYTAGLNLKFKYMCITMHSLVMNPSHALIVDTIC